MNPTSNAYLTAIGTLPAGPSDVELLAAALDAMPAHVSLVDADLRYRWVNKRYEDWYRTPRERIIGRTLQEVMSPEQFALVEPYARQALAGNPVRYEAEFPAPGGGSQVFEVSYVPAPGGEGFHVLSIDRTEERRATKALQESRERYAALVNHLPGAVYRSRFNEQWNAEYISDGVEALTGYPARDFTASPPVRSYLDLIHPEDLPRVQREAQAAFAEGKPYETEYRIRHRDGSARWVYDKGQATPAQDGSGLLVEGVGFDITQRKLAESALRESEARYRALIEGVPDLIFLLSGDGIFLDCHAAQPEQLLAPKAAFLGRHLTEIFSPDLSQRFLQVIQSANLEGCLQQLEYPLEINGESRQYECRVVPCGEGRALSLVRDITERSRRDQAMRQIAEGVSAATGAEFFRSLVTHLAGVLRADCVIVGKLLGPERERVRTLAVFADGQVTEGFEYALPGTPCEQVVQRSLCCYPAGVQALFPLDQQLVEMGAEAYVGTPLTDSSGQTLGLLAALWKKSMASTEIAESLLRIFAVRAAAEIERLRAEEGLRLAARVFETAAEGIMITDAEQRVVSLNDAFAQITGYSEAGLVGQSMAPLQSGLHGDEFFREIDAQVSERGQWQGEMWIRRKDGAAFPAWISISAVRNAAGAIGNLVFILNDISSLKASQQRLEQLANFDSLTGLPNRNLFQDRFAHGMDKARRQRARLALLFLDLDNFKVVNDTLGHHAGDRLLAGVAQRLRESVREQDTVARLGGDEFVVMLDDVKEPQQAARMAERVVERFEQPFDLDGREHFVAFSMGVALFPDDGDSLPVLLRNADLALYRAKEYGRNSFRFFTEDMNVQAFERQFLENSLDIALEKGEFVPRYQPVVETATGRIVAMEALLHWNQPDMGPMPASRFLGVAEQSGLIVRIGAWVLKAACHQAADWNNAGHRDLRICINLSPRQLRNPGLLDSLREAVTAAGVRPQNVELDIPETAAMLAEVGATLAQLRRLGVRIAIDDFGTGYSSIPQLRRLPIDTLKIDYSLVRDVPVNPDAVSTVMAIIAMAKNLKLRVVAEGVETPAQRDFLIKAGCELAQGFLYSAALPEAKAGELLKSGTIGPAVGTPDPASGDLFR